MRSTNSGKCPTCGALLLFAVEHDRSVEAELLKWLEYVELQGLATSYTRKIAQRVRDYIQPYFRGVDVRNIRTFHVEEFYVHLLKARKLAPKTVKHVLDTLRAFLNRLHRIDLIERVPVFPRVKAKEAVEKVWIGPDVQDEVIELIAERHRLLYRVLCETGIRPGEVCALKRKDLRPDGLWIERAVDEQGFEKPTKTGKCYLRPLSPELLADLQEHNGLKFPEVRMFIDHGEPYTQKKLYFIWRRAASKIGVKISLYNASRHSLVSQKRKELEAGMHEALRAELAHTSARTTLKHYALPGSKEIKR